MNQKKSGSRTLMWSVIMSSPGPLLCIGGGICKEGETLLAPLRAYVERNRYSRFSKKQTLLCAATLGNDAGVVGAASLGETI